MALLHAPRDQTYTYTVRAADGAPAGSVAVQPERRRKVAHSPAPPWPPAWVLVVLAAIVLVGFGLLRRVARSRRRVRD